LGKEMITGTAEIANTTPHAQDGIDPRFQELERVVRSDTFSKSPRLATLLKHICERTWAGQADELSEQQIGIHFFHRPPGFNAGEDAIVRGTARHLRKRLDLYYESEGKQNPARISVPKGGYVARFEEVSQPPAESVLATTEVSHEPAESHGSRHPPLWLIAALVLLVIGGIGLWRHIHNKQSNQADGPLILWKTIFQPNRRTVIVAGDSALNLYTAYTHHAVPLRVYMEQEYQLDPAMKAVSPEGPGLISKVNAATMADLKITSELVRVPYREGIAIPDKNVEVRYARDINEADLHDANLVLLGASTFDPWVTVYDKNLDFHLDRGFEHYTFRVLNNAPRQGEDAIITKGNEQALTTVAFTETPTGNEHVLLIGGSTMGSIYAAEHFLFTQRMWQPIIDAATQHGKLHDFEVVLRSDFVKDEVSNTRVITFHVH
jgi:hypothetical protein